MKVVIIDDDKSSGKALADLLETKYDMEVLGCALCGLDGLAMVNRYQPDVLFLDVQLPDVNGLDFLDKLSGFVHRRCQVVMYTAYDEYILTAFRKKAFDVLLKPINPQELDTIVRRLEKEAKKAAEKSRKKRAAGKTGTAGTKRGRGRPCKAPGGIDISRALGG